MARGKKATVTIITAVEIGEVYEVSPNTVKKWRQRYESFPDPVGYGIRGPRRDTPNWEWDSVRVWVARYLPHLLVGREIKFPLD